jgi:hypothetical protein
MYNKFRWKITYIYANPLVTLLPFGVPIYFSGKGSGYKFNDTFAPATFSGEVDGHLNLSFNPGSYAARFNLSRPSRIKTLIKTW